MDKVNLTSAGGETEASAVEQAVEQVVEQEVELAVAVALLPLIIGCWQDLEPGDVAAEL